MATPRIVRFDSMGAFLQYVEIAPVLSEKRASESSNGTWAGTDTFKQALTLARDGWQNEAHKINQLSSPIIERITSLVERSSIIYDVEGIGIDVARYLDGEPECWQRWDTQYVESQGTRHVHIVFNVAVSAGIDTEVIRARGAAVAALIESLEYSGARVRLDVALGYGKWEAYINIKAADQPLDVPRMAYALGNPSMLRRLCFRLLECQPEHKLLGVDEYGYGGIRWKGYDFTAPCSVQGDIYFAASALGEPQWTDAKSTTQWIMNQIKKQGVTLHE